MEIKLKKIVDTGNLRTATNAVGTMNAADDENLSKEKKKPWMFPPGIEPGTFRVLGERDNRYTMETTYDYHQNN